MSSSTKWVLDPSHSELLFKVKHLMISNVKGEFRKFHAEIHGEDFSSASIKVTVDTSSVFTNDDNRDAHLKGADFFDCEHYQEMVFLGKSFNHIKGEQWKPPILARDGS